MHDLQIWRKCSFSSVIPSFFLLIYMLINSSILWWSIQYFPVLTCFSGPFSIANNLIRQKNTPWKVDEMIALSDTGRKTLQTGKPGEFYQNRKTPGDIGRLDRSASEKFLQIKCAMHHTFISACFLFTRFTWF